MLPRCLRNAHPETRRPYWPPRRKLEWRATLHSNTMARLSLATLALAASMRAWLNVSYPLCRASPSGVPPSRPRMDLSASRPLAILARSSHAPRIRPAVRALAAVLQPIIVEPNGPGRLSVAPPIGFSGRASAKIVKRYPGLPKEFTHLALDAEVRLQPTCSSNERPRSASR